MNMREFQSNILVSFSTTSSGWGGEMGEREDAVKNNIWRCRDFRNLWFVPLHETRAGGSSTGYEAVLEKYSTVTRC